MSETAQSYDSYMDTLLIVLDEIRPQYVFEWGTGKSTQVISMYNSVKKLTSIEHDKEWFERAFRGGDNTVVYQPDLNKYATEIEGEKPQDIIFVDGKNRNECLEIAMDYLTPYSAVMLHDANRSEYVTSMYPYKIYTDDGHTLTMTFNKDMYKALLPKLENLKNVIGVRS